MILDIASVWHPTYEPQQWQQYLIYVALIWIAVALNVFSSGWVPLYNKLIFVLSCLTLSGTTLALFIAARNNHATADFIFSDTTNRSGVSAKCPLYPQSGSLMTVQKSLRYVRNSEYSIDHSYINVCAP